MKRKQSITAALIAVIALGAAGSAAAGVCKDVRFKVTNDHFEKRAIEIRSIKFRNPHKGGKLQTENVRNKLCFYGATCTTAGDNLANADKVDLYDIQVVFRHKNNDGSWSKQFKTRPFAPKYRKCTTGKQYGPIVVTDKL